MDGEIIVNNALHEKLEPIFKFQRIGNGITHSRSGDESMGTRELRIGGHGDVTIVRKHMPCHRHNGTWRRKSSVSVVEVHIIYICTIMIIVARSML
jgi:hypothetical protein